MVFNVASSVKYIGQDDATLRFFESQYPVPDGMCYNSYLILDNKVAVMDTSDRRTVAAWLQDLSQALEGRKPDYLVVHHLEPDHAFGIAMAVQAYPELQIVCSAKAAQMLPLYFPDTNLSDRIMTMADGSTLELGNHKLTFFMTPMVHWPEVMMSFDSFDGLLFSADAFGKFGTYRSDADDWETEAARYYFNICGKYGAPVSAALRKASAFDIKKVLPLHGPVLEGERLTRAMELYAGWSQYKPQTDGVLIACASIHGNSLAAARKLQDILQEQGCKNVALVDLSVTDVSYAVSKAFQYSQAVFVASSYDAGLFPPMQSLLQHLQAKAWQNRRVAVVENGSWAPSAGRVMTELLSQMKSVTVCSPLVTLRGALKPQDIPALQTLARDLLS